MTENKAAILQIFETLNRKIKQFEDEKNKAVKFIHSMTEKESEFLYRESDSGLNVIKAGDNLFRVKFDEDTKEVDYVIHKDDFIYKGCSKQKWTANA